MSHECCTEQADRWDAGMEMQGFGGRVVEGTWFRRGSWEGDSEHMTFMQQPCCPGSHESWLEGGTRWGSWGTLPSLLRQPEEHRHKA